MLALLTPGPMPAPWLGSLSALGPLSGLNETLQEPFPVKASRKPSYSSAPVVWIKPAALHSDVQKILRHARKMADKTAHFYKELNRLKRNAVSLGHYELLESVASTFDREAVVLQAQNAHPECALQLRHAAEELRSNRALQYDHVIQPRPK